MSSPPESPKSRFSLLDKIFQERTLSASNLNVVGTAIRRAAPVLGAVGSSSVMMSSQRLDPLVKPRTDQVWTPFRLALSKLHNCEYPGVLSPLKSAIGALCTCIDLVDMATENDEEQKRLVSGIINIMQSLARYMEDSDCTPAPNVIDRAVKSLDKCVAKLESKREVAGIRRFGEAQLHHKEIIHCCEEIERILQQLQIEITLSSLKLLDEISVNNKLQLLNPSKLARYDSESSAGVDSKGCTPDTRKNILLDLESWSNALGSSRLQWMSGMAGTGKTTIAYTYSKTLDNHRRLAASFFCSRKTPECRNANRIVPTIAYQLARFSAPFRAELCAVLNKDPDLGHSNIPKQFEYLLRTPLHNIGRMPENIVVVLDALDECEDPYSMEAFLRHLIEYVDKFPLKFLVTSRPESKIHLKMIGYHDSRSIKPMRPLHEIDKSSVQADIKLYLQQGLASMSLPDSQLTELVQQCGSLFIYAATLVRYIRPDDKSIPSIKRLEQILSMSANYTKMHTELDLLYSVVLNTALDNNLEEQEVDGVQAVLRTVLCAQEPIRVETIAALCGFDDIGIPSFALERLRSVIHLSETNGLVSAFHVSFPDFIFDQGRSKTWFCDRAKHNSLMTKQCFRLMKELRFNMCQIETSYVPDEVLEREGKINIDDVVQPSLWYASRYWADHMCRTTASDDLFNELRRFISQRLLFWMEVLNLKHDVALGADILLKASLWLPADISANLDLVSLAEDARNFVTSFAASPVSISTPHIYTSLLPFCPRSSSVSQNYRKNFKGLVEPDQHAMHVREVAALASWRLGSEVSSVAYSRDGTHIAFGCIDGTVDVLSSYDGTTTFGVSGGSGHNLPVWSVAFSPHDKIGNQAYVISGSDDGTIRIWNLPDGAARVVIGPLPGEIKCVASSPNGSIASGSSDCTVCIWDSSDGKLLAGPFRGHEGEIWSIAFSPDGAFIASGSDDRTIRIWNPQNGQLVLGPLTAQMGDINSIAFSPDGARMASGSSDRTICVWDPHQGTVISEPFPAHNDRVTSVTFSPNGKHLASGSFDRTIRVWNPVTGELTAGPFEGHIGPVYSIAFSPDNTRIISGSPDKTIRLWDPRKGVLSDGGLESHSDAVASVAFSPNGQHMASCSYDGTLRLWAVRDTIPSAVGGPLRGHTDQVLSLAFSPDSTRIVTGSADQTARVWDITGQSSPPIIFEGHKSAIWSVAFSSDSSFVASAGGSGDETIRLWNSSTGTPIVDPLTGHTDEVLSIAVSPEGSHLASGSRDTTLRVWNLKDMSTLRLLQGHTRAVWSVVYSFDGTKLASCSSDGTIRVWNPQNGSLILKPTVAHGERVSSIAFSPDDNYIASGADDCTIRLWDTNTGDLVSGPYEGHCDIICSVSFSPSGAHIVSGSHDGTIRLWDIKNNTPVVSRGDTGANAIADGDWELRPDGWIKHESDLLLWVPHEVARSLLTPHCSGVVSSCGPLRIDFHNLKLGESWQDCYVAQSDE